MVKRRRWNVDGDVQDEIEDLARTKPSWSAAQIHKHVSSLRDYKGRVPHYKTVQEMVRYFRPPDPSKDWALIEASDEEIRPILDVLAHVIERTRGEQHRVSNRDAELILKVHCAAPDMSPRHVWWFAMNYKSREAAGEGSDDLDAWLAFWPQIQGADEKQREEIYEHLWKLWPRLKGFHLLEMKTIVEAGTVTLSGAASLRASATVERMSSKRIESGEDINGEA